jgi:phosphoglycolate phosphatase-like HAD superfamily hydrolase
MSIVSELVGRKARFVERESTGGGGPGAGGRDNGSVLVLFDIDGTLLLRASEEHASALRGALAAVYGVETTAKVPAAGRTDTAIARELAALGGVDAARFDQGLERFKELTAARFAQCCPPSLRDRVAPGMGELLAALAARGDVRCSLVSGNYEAVARLKLARAGIDHHFPAGQGAFGSDAEARNELPPIARARAGGCPRERTIVVGDTPLDVACARADGLRVLAVATGPHAASELGGADGVAADGWELGELLAGELELSARGACS